MCSDGNAITPALSPTVSSVFILQTQIWHIFLACISNDRDRTVCRESTGQDREDYIQ